jgi:hypothetical protein
VSIAEDEPQKFYHHWSVHSLIHLNPQSCLHTNLRLMFLCQKHRSSTYRGWVPCCPCPRSQVVPNAMHLRCSNLVLVACSKNGFFDQANKATGKNEQKLQQNTFLAYFVAIWANGSKPGTLGTLKQLANGWLFPQIW